MEYFNQLLKLPLLRHEMVEECLKIIVERMRTSLELLCRYFRVWAINFSHTLNFANTISVFINLVQALIVSGIQVLKF